MFLTQYKATIAKFFDIFSLALYLIVVNYKIIEKDFHLVLVF